VRVEHIVPVVKVINTALAVEALRVAKEAMKNQYVERRALDTRA